MDAPKRSRALRWKVMEMMLEDRYLERCRQIARDIKGVLDARRTVFLSMIGEVGPVGATKALVHADRPSDTFVDLMVHRRLDLSVEWVIVNEREWDPLFSREDREAARARLGNAASAP